MIFSFFGRNTQKELTCGAVCVYPARVGDAYAALKSINMSEKIPVASVATGFPSGQYSLETRLAEIRTAVADGASEIDIVINRTAALQSKWRRTYTNICNVSSENSFEFEMTFNI